MSEATEATYELLITVLADCCSTDESIELLERALNYYQARLEEED